VKANSLLRFSENVLPSAKNSVFSSVQSGCYEAQLAQSASWNGLNRLWRSQITIIHRRME
jgi:hypothetical protein